VTILADVRSPVDGVIVEVNARVLENPGLTNREPYGDGWLFLVRTPDIKSAAKKLMERYAKHRTGSASEVNVFWKRWLPKSPAPWRLMVELLDRIFMAIFRDLDWRKLTQTFLKTD
jgi:hypothetical protein